MRHQSRRYLTQWLRLAGIGTVAVFVLAGCGGASNPTATASPARSTPTGSASAPALASASSAPGTSAQPSLSLGPATAQLTIAGDAGQAGALTKPTIRCSEPSFDGLTIDMFAQPADTSVLDRIVVTGGKVTVRLAAGSGTTYTERDFAGTGVTGFDPATGAQIDSTLTETTDPGLKRGSLGAITSLKGSVACNDQRPGRSTLVLTATIPEGQVDGPLDPASVVCSADGKNLSIIGLTQAGSTPTLSVIVIANDHFSVALAPKSGSTLFYTVDAPGVASLAAGTGHASGDATQPSGGASALKIHLAGDATCG